MPCYLKLMPKNLITEAARKSKKEAQKELKRALADKRIGLVAYDALRQKIDGCVEVAGHTHEHEHAGVSGGGS